LRDFARTGKIPQKQNHLGCVKTCFAGRQARQVFTQPQLKERPLKSIAKVSWLILIILLVDQSVKVWVKTHMALGDEIRIFGLEWALIHFVENPGMAFGYQLSNDDMGKLALSLFRILAVGFLAYYIRFLIRKKAGWGVLASFALILAGALGNIIDSAFYGLIFSESTYHSGVAQLFPEGGGYERFLHGNVVDMFYFPIWSGYLPNWIPLWGGQHFMFFKPVFNVADVSITLGVLNILTFQRQFFLETNVGEKDASEQEQKSEEAPAIEDAKESTETEE
jgi:signal peptidase II